MPEYAEILVNSCRPTLWVGVETKAPILVLANEKREAYIVAGGHVNNEALRRLSGNLNDHAYSHAGTLVVSPGLMKQLIGVSGSNAHSDRLQRLKSEPMLRFRSWLEIARKMEASDLHLETLDSKGVVRVRAHGEMWALDDALEGKYPAQQIIETISSIYQNLTQVKSNSTSIWKPDRDAYTMLNFELGGEVVKMRFQAIAGHKGPKAILRIFSGSNKPSQTIPELGYEDSMQKEIWAAQQTTNGLVCITGITGSGKTHTIRAFVETHPDNGSIVINTVEDPVELEIKGAHQKSVQRSFDDSDEEVRKKYIGAVNSMLRGDIDIGMVGELRDDISANAWLGIAQTGHMGIATLHAHRLHGIIPRLTDDNLNLSRDVLATPQIINLFIYQALIPGNCPACMLTTDEFLANKSADKNSAHEYIEQINRLDLDATYFRWRNPNGCSECRGRGTKGQVLLAELLTPDYKWLDLILANKDVEAFDYHRHRGVFDLKSKDMFGRSIVEHGLLKVQDSRIDIRTLARFEKFSDFTDNYLRLKAGNERVRQN
ncbi:ATPase, T2SS/T4P/T4SS family [Comamonas sp. w2-DMI]|uniref:ATPase, T2SS/T4P/T4SS family n=1 Tax=Comamonas sp. w2-DMI TaxID=3126391 RepID=UPI0032E4C2E2